jgi:hypothetical protein
MRGDPAAGGSLDVLYTADGIFGPNSYCFDGWGNLYYMGTGGLYKIAKGGGAPEPLTCSRLPTMMSSIDRATHRITLGFDRKRFGIKIAITTIATGADTDYWYDLRTDGFFPESYSTGAGVFSQVYYDANNSAYNHLCLGCNDGYIRYFKDDTYSDQAADDSAVAITSYVLYGPVNISQGNREGMINNLYISTGSSTTNALYNVYVNNSAQQLVDDVGNAGLFSGTFSTGGRQYNIRDKISGAFMGVKIGNSTAAKTFAIEKIEFDATVGGKLKRI